VRLLAILAAPRYLANVDTRYCHERQVLLGQVRAQEAALARLLRLPMVYTHPQLSLDPAYLDFLQRTTAAAAERGPAGEGRFQDVPVMVQPDPSQVGVGVGWGGGRAGGWSPWKCQGRCSYPVEAGAVR
jgi:hypothetical protein